MQTASPNVNIHYAKTHLSRLIDEVATTGKPITIVKAGTPNFRYTDTLIIPKSY